MNRLQALIARRGRQSAKDRPQAMLLGLSEMPCSGWRVFSEGVWRTGSWGLPSSEEARVAYRAGLFGAIRWYEQVQPSRYMEIKIVEYVSKEHAESIMHDFKAQLTPIPRAQVTLVEERVIHDLEVSNPGNAWVYEQLTVGAERPSYSRFIAGNVDNVVIMVNGTGFRGLWPWEEVKAVAAAQGLKVERVLAEASGG